LINRRVSLGLTREKRRSGRQKGKTSEHSPSGIVAGHAPSGIVAGHAPSGIVAGHAPSGIFTGHTPSGIVTGHSPSGIVTASFLFEVFRRQQRRVSGEDLFLGVQHLITPSNPEYNQSGISD